MGRSRAGLITGGGAGIGAAVAARLAAEGCALTLLDVDAVRLAETAERLRKTAVAAVRARIADVRDPDQVRDAVAEAVREQGAVDVLVNAVGGSTPARPVEEISDAEWEACLGLNLRGLFFCTRAVVPHMKARRWGRIVNVSSVAGRTRSLFGGAHYTTAKAGVVGFTRQCAHELGPHGITVNVVAPGVTLSERVVARWEAKPADERAFIQSLIPVGRCATPDEPAAAIAFLCSEDAGYVNGAILDVNGGLYIG